MVELLQEAQASYGALERQAGKRFAALEQLIGHPRVYLEDRPGEPIPVRTGNLELVAVSDSP